MPRFFVQKRCFTGTSVTIEKPDSVHIGRSLRMRIGDEIIACCDGVEYDCKIESISDECVVCDIISSQPSESEPDVRVTLYQALPKGDKLDSIVQKATELGAAQICPVLTSRCVARADKKSFEKKRERLSRIALEAAKQSGRGIVPQVTELLTLEEAAEQLAQNDFPLICYERGGKNLADAGLKNNSTIGIFIGSEGGFEQSDVELCTSKGAVAIGLGKRILRCETAPVTALSIVMNLTGNI
ncbi:MAG: 16S rRNA (uracil(1498)-N(3))-methyltransferase [Ruminococcus sp.]|nr:16S rRNA (uracil(1498)-N(3))-methyltransferase [Ruminococcus sp.]